MESTSEVVSNSVAVEGSAENAKTEQQSVAAEVTITIKEHAEEDKKSEVVEQTVAEKKEVEQNEEPTSADEEEVEEVVEEVVVEDCDDAEDEVKETIKEEVIDSTDGGKTKTTTVVTVEKVTPAGTKTVVTTTSVTKEAPTATTTIITTPPTPTTEEVKTQQTEAAAPTKVVSEVKKEESIELEEEEEVSEEEEEEEEVEEEEETKKEDNEKIVEATDLNKSEELSQQQLHKDQTVQEAESQPQPQPKETTPVKEQTVVDAPSVVPQSNEQENNKQNNLNNTLKDIISSIDSNIKAEENIAALKERELELLKKQQELAKEIEQQKLLAQKLANENLTQQQINNSFTHQQSTITPKTYQPISNVSKYSTFEEKQDENVYTRKSETYETTESTNVSKKIDLDKIFTPATDSEEILPKNRKLYASSAFYSPTLHPTVEDQVELARRISHSLSDISNQQSRGQCMYVNRKKRSVKWVHEGCGQEEDENIKITNQNAYHEEEKENNVSHHEKVPLKFLMNPSGQMRDIHSLRESLNTETGLLSPDVSAEVMTALQAQTGKGAELFAKRRKVSEKWVVDESNVGAQSPSGLPDYHQYQQQPRPSTSPSILPAYTDAAKHRVQLNLHQEQLLEKYAKPGLKVVQTPWEAALNSGSASAAFVEEQKLSPYPTSTLTPSPTPQLYDASQGGVPVQCAPTDTGSYSKPYSTTDYPKYQTYTASVPQAQHEPQQYSGTNSQRELAYKPSIPQGWKAPSMSLPKDLYMPKEIPLQSYAPPPVAAIPPSVSPFSSNVGYESSHNSYKPHMAPYSLPESAPAANKPYGGGSTFPVSKPNQHGFASTYGSNQPPKQQYLPPQSYQTRTENTSHNIPQVNFNPSPLPYDKLAKFENQSADEGRYINSPLSNNSHLNVRGGNKVRNVSPAPFGGSYNSPCTPSSDTHYYGGTPSPVSPRPLSSMQQYSGHTTPNLTHPSVTSTQILNAPSYNTSARGWGCSGGTSTGYQHHPRSHLSASKPQVVNAASMPYTDF